MVFKLFCIVPDFLPDTWKLLVTFQFAILYNYRLIIGEKKLHNILKYLKILVDHKKQ